MIFLYILYGSCLYTYFLFDVFVAIDGAGGKGTWGKLLDTDGESIIDRNDPNYDSGEVMRI